MKSLITIDAALSAIAKERDASITSLRKGILHRVHCGKLLFALKKIVPEGEWEKTLAKISFPKATAWRYICTFQDFDPVAGRLKSGANLVHSLRSDDLVNAVEPGGYQSDVYQRRKLSGQMEMDFAYEEFATHITSLANARNVEELSPATLHLTLRKLDAARARVVAVLKDKEALQLTPEHQP